MYIVKRKNNIRLICAVKKLTDHGTNLSVNIVVYRVQIKVLWFWTTIKEFDEDDYCDAFECYKYCTNPYKIN